MTELRDDEFGLIKLTRSARASYVRIRVGTDGTLRASLPTHAPVLLVKRLLKNSRSEIRSLLETHRSTSVFTTNMQIGKSHTLVTRPTSAEAPSVSRHGQQIIASLPEGVLIEETEVQSLLRPAVIAALRKEAKAYLPRRLAYLAEQHGFTYQKVRFSHASGRWGSCSSAGTISLNIALMKLPLELIDYVLLHELGHTVEMNHSSAFWAIVEQCDPNYKLHRKQIKDHTPSI